jgi:hypothetical protein
MTNELSRRLCRMHGTGLRALESRAYDRGRYRVAALCLEEIQAR